MHAIKRHILHSAPAAFMFPLQKQIQREIRTAIRCYQNSSVALLLSPEDGIQQKSNTWKIRNYKRSTSPGAETNQQVSPLSTQTALARKGITALGNESEQLGRDLGHGASRKPSAPLGTWKDEPLSLAPMPLPWEACTHTGETCSAIRHGCATKRALGPSCLKNHHQKS